MYQVRGQVFAKAVFQQVEVLPPGDGFGKSFGRLFAAFVPFRRPWLKPKTLNPKP